MKDVDLGGSPLGAWAPTPSGAVHTATRLAWEYLLPDHPMTRRVDTHEIHSARRWNVSMQIDLRIPPSASAGTFPLEKGRCLVPVAFLARRKVAPDLVVRNGASETVPVPTIAANMELTKKALQQISADAAITFNRPGADYALSDDLLKLCGDIIEMESHRARFCRLKVEKEMQCPALEWLLPLLRRFEDDYVLWVPIEGKSGSEHRLSVRCSRWRWHNPIWPQKRKREVPVEFQSSVGPIKATWDPPHKWLRGLPNLPAAVGRILIACGLMPVTLKEEAFEAHRFSSYRMCIAPPDGFLLRELKIGKIRESDWGIAEPKIQPLKAHLDLTVDGQDSRLGHIRLAMKPNPSRFFARATIGLRPETITLWGMVAVFTCGLLWAFHRNIQELALLDDRAKVALGVLLIGPTFASAWTLREKDRALMRSTLSGTRFLMLTSAALSVATALAVAGLQPFGWKVGEAVSWYASISYTIAAIIVTGWLQTRGVTWFIFRRVLTKPKWNLVATIALALAAYLCLSEIGRSQAAGAVALLLIGLGFTVVAANRSSNPLGEVNHLPSVLAGIAAIATLAIASREMYFYNYIADRTDVRAWGLMAELVIAGAGALLLLSRYALRLYRRKRAGKEGMSLQTAEAASI